MKKKSSRTRDASATRVPVSSMVVVAVCKQENTSKVKNKMKKRTYQASDAFRTLLMLCDKMVVVSAPFVVLTRRCGGGSWE